MSSQVSPSAPTPVEGARKHRLTDLLGMRIRFADGRDGDQVTDVRLEPGDRVRGTHAELVAVGFVVGKRRPGTLFGYDRHPEMGPWIVRVIIRAMHRRTGYVRWEDVEAVDWEQRQLRLRVNQLRDLPTR